MKTKKELRREFFRLEKSFEERIANLKTEIKNNHSNFEMLLNYLGLEEEEYSALEPRSPILSYYWSTGTKTKGTKTEAVKKIRLVKKKKK